ncbi:hypothetical protein [Salegentibacter chungangensis]|uniref:Uncharacterized protein n=1 Tax=Salegentibacter chungangensis TaxID=1335724 RepID=A0ABW3NP25_9FLAO
MIRIFRRLAFFIFILLQFIFLFSIFFEKFDTPLLLGFLLLLSALLSLAYYNSPRQEEEFFIKDVFLIFFVVLGAVISYFINLDFGPVIAAGATGTIASFLPSVLKKKKQGIIAEFPAAVYCGAFVGMTAPSVAGNLSFIIFSGFLAGSFLLLAKNIFNGFGGKLGTIAFGGVALSSAIIYLVF